MVTVFSYLAIYLAIWLVICIFWWVFKGEKYGISGINLLLYRYTEDQKRLLAATKEVKVPLIVAGNVVNYDQVHELKQNEVWAFTIGGAVLEKFVKKQF